MKWLMAGVCALGATPAFFLPDRPPLAHTGGFGEPTCVACHFDNSINDPAGSLGISGVPDRYQPGEVYRVSVQLVRAGVRRGGFELAARTAEGTAAGRQAGILEALDPRTDVTDSLKVGTGRIQYARHTQLGSEHGDSDTLRWTVKWTAPAAGTGAVIFHVVGNAANDDNSPLGDYVYTASVTVKGR